MDRYEVLFNEMEEVFVINKNDKLYAKFPNQLDVEHFLTILVESTKTMSPVDIDDDVFNEDWTCLFFHVHFEPGEGIILTAGPDYYSKWK